MVRSEIAMSQNRFQGRVVVITGASSGIGRAAAFEFAREGARLVLVARNESQLREVAERCSHLNPANTPLIIAGDIADPAVSQRAVERALEQWNRVDIIIANAGIGHNLRVDELTAEQTARLFDTNVFGTLHIIRAALPQMKSQPPVAIGGRNLHGQIFIVSSVVAFMGIPQMGIYCATKSAQRALAQSLRHELKRDAIEVIAVYPGRTHTEFFTRSISDGRPWMIENEMRMSPEAVARAMLRASLHHRRHIILTASGKLFYYMSRFTPRLADWGTALVYRHYKSRRPPDHPSTH
jgi:short-subunit dehydrogenase